MNFAYSPRVEALRQQLQAFMDDHIVPRIGAWHAEVAAGQYPVSFMEDLKALAREEDCGTCSCHRLAKTSRAPG